MQTPIKRDISKETMKMPWYMNPVKTCKVLNRIANRHKHAPIRDLNTLLDHATQRLWTKQEHYYEKRSFPRQVYTAGATTERGDGSIHQAGCHE